MKNKLLAMGGIIAALVFGFMILRDPGHIPLLDANRTLLAETAAQGYCAAAAHFETQGQIQFDECVEESDRGDEYDVNKVLPAFCLGVTQYLPMTAAQCVDEVKRIELWPTAEPKKVGPYTIWITDDWNKKFPYPLRELGVGEPDDSRTGGRDDITRIGESRP